MKLKTTFAGFNVEFDTETKIYRAFDDDGNVIKETQSEDALKKCLANGGEKKKKLAFKRIPVIHSSYSGWIRGEVTSLAESSRYGSGEDVWATFDKERGKYAIGNLYLDTPENHAIMAEMDALEAERKKLGKIRDKKKESLKTLTVEALGGSNGQD